MTVKQTTTSRQEASIYLRQSPCPVTLAPAQQHSCKVGGPRLPPTTTTSPAAESPISIQPCHLTRLASRTALTCPFVSQQADYCIKPSCHRCYSIELGNLKDEVDLCLQRRREERGGGKGRGRGRRLAGLLGCIDRAKKKKRHSRRELFKKLSRLSLATLNAAANVWEERACQSFKLNTHRHTHTHRRLALWSHTWMPLEGDNKKKTWIPLTFIMKLNISWHRDVNFSRWTDAVCVQLDSNGSAHKDVLSNVRTLVGVLAGKMPH